MSLLAELRTTLPDFRGRLTAGDSLAPMSWFRVGGPAEVLMVPADAADLADALARIPAEVPVMPLGLGSNVILRDGGVPGVVVKLGRGFNGIAVEADCTLRAGAGVPDVKVARAAADAAIDGLAFFRGIPGSIGGALRMNAGAHGGETTDVLVEARGVDRDGTRRAFTRTEMGFTYRHSSAPSSIIFTEATFRGRPGDPATILAEMDRITAAREASQPIREKTGGSTFKNPPGGQGLAAHRRSGLPRPDGRRRADVGDALQLPHQPRPGDGAGHRGPGRGGPAARVRDQRHHARLGNQADRRAGSRLSRGHHPDRVHPGRRSPELTPDTVRLALSPGERACMQPRRFARMQPRVRSGPIGSPTRPPCPTSPAGRPSPSS